MNVFGTDIKDINTIFESYVKELKLSATDKYK